MITGLSLVIASACVTNNYLDRGIDTLMVRTKRRAIATGVVSPQQALTYAAMLGTFGVLILALYTNPLTLWLAVGGFFSYVVLYGIGKRKSVYGTEIGSVAGAVPPVVGYCAVTGRLDIGAIILFLILVFWQMPHFYSIAMFRLDDYKSAGIPVLPAKKGIARTKLHMLAYIIGFIIAVSMLYFFGYAGRVYLVVALGLGLAWFALWTTGLKATDNTLWAKKMFRFSLIVITALAAIISLSSILP